MKAMNYDPLQCNKSAPRREEPYQTDTAIWPLDTGSERCKSFESYLVSKIEDEE